MDEEQDRQRRVIAEQAFLARYTALMERWRQGEVLSLERWGRRRPETTTELQAAAREMAELGRDLEALLVGFG